MELKSPKAKKKSSVSRLESWRKLLRTPILILFLLGTSSCDSDSSDELFIPNSNVTEHLRHRHHILPNTSLSLKDTRDREVLSEIRYLRRHLNREIINFVMADVLVDGEVENRVHYNGITAKETYVGTDGNGLRLRQLTDGRHLVQIIYTPNGEIQDCEYITQGKSARNFLKTLRKELKLALDEESYRITQQDRSSEDEKFFRHFGNVTFRILKDGEKLPRDVASWLDYDKMKMECLQRHEELKYMMENRNKVGDSSLAR